MRIPVISELYNHMGAAEQILRQRVRAAHSRGGGTTHTKYRLETILVSSQQVVSMQIVPLNYCLL